MFALKSFVRSPAVVIALVAACLSTSAHAGWDGQAGWGVGPNNNGWGIGGPVNNGFRGPIDNGPRPGEVGTFRGVGSRQNFGINPYYGWSMDPFAANLGVGRDFGPINGYVFGINGLQYGGGAAAASIGLNMPNTFSVNAYGIPSYGLPGSDLGSMYLGVVNPWGGGWGMGPQQNLGFGPFPALGMNPQQSMGFMMPFPYFGMNPQQNVGMPMFNPWMGMNPYAQMPMQPASAQQQGGVQGVQCTINGVGVLTKDADDCEKADGEVVKAKTAKQ